MERTNLFRGGRGKKETDQVKKQTSEIKQINWELMEYT